MKINSADALESIRRKAAKALAVRESNKRAGTVAACGLDLGTPHIQILCCGGTGCKASESAKKHLVNVAMKGTTIPHRIDGLYGTAKVVLIPAEEGAGVIAGGGARAVLELAGIKDVRTKTFGTSNRINTVKATIDGLSRLRDAETVAKMRGKTVEEILG